MFRSHVSGLRLLSTFALCFGSYSSLGQDGAGGSIAAQLSLPAATEIILKSNQALYDFNAANFQPEAAVGKEF